MFDSDEERDNAQVNDDGNNEDGFDFLDEVGLDEAPTETTEETSEEGAGEETTVDVTEEEQGEETVEEVTDDTQETEEEEAGTTAEEEEEEGQEVVEEEEEEDDDDSDDENADPRDSIIAELQQRLDKLEGKKDEPAAPTAPALEIPEDLQQRILGDLDIDDVTSDPKLFVQVLENALKVGAEVSREATMKSIPQLVMQQVKGYTDLQAMSKKFYNEHKVLRPYKNAVATAANEIHSEHPDWDYPKIMKTAAKRVKKSLNLTSKKKTQTVVTKGKKQKPAFAKTPPAKKTKAQVSKLQNDIDNTIL